MDYEFSPVPDDWIDVDHPHLRIGHDGTLGPVDPGHDGYRYDAAPGGPDWNPEDDMRVTEAHAERDVEQSFELGIHDFGMSERKSASAMIEDREMIWRDYVSTGEATVEYGRAYDKMVETFNRTYNPDEEVPKSKETGYYSDQIDNGTEGSPALPESQTEINDPIVPDEQSATQEELSREERDGRAIGGTTNWGEKSDSSEWEGPDFENFPSPNWDSILLGGPPFSDFEFDLNWLSDDNIGLLREALVLPEWDVDQRSEIIHNGVEVPTVPEWVLKWRDSAHDPESALTMHMKGSGPR